MDHIFQKTVKVLKTYGIREVMLRTRLYTGRKLLGKYFPQVPEPAPEMTEVSQTEGTAVAEELVKDGPPVVDVLFINGCDQSVPHPPRYRVTHQRDQLAAFNITSDEVYYPLLQLEQVKYAHVFIFFRCPYTDTIGAFIELAKSLNKTVLFDIDDLVIDTKYTDTIKYIQAMTKEERAIYDDGVNRMGHTLKLCEGAITTTERLATELSHYVPEVFINRNTASERMYQLSEAAHPERNDSEIRIGYFSGSITHNDDFKLILPSLLRMMKKYEQVYLYVVGELSLPRKLKKYEARVRVLPFMSWEQLPEAIAACDINLAPIEETIFNEAKSENKWVEASLVHVVTVASDVGAFKRMIRHGETGFLCRTEADWDRVLESLIVSRELRTRVADQAYRYVKKNCLTLYTGKGLADHIQSKMRESVAFCLPSTEISGGIMVALRHASILKKQGAEVTIIASNPSLEWMEYEGEKFPVIYEEKCPVDAWFDKAIATMWSTTPFVEKHPKIGQRYYLVQNFEVDFYLPGDYLRPGASRTYRLPESIKYITISKWCRSWLDEEYGRKAAYAPNGIDTGLFYPSKREESGKLRILIEGDCAVTYKGVDESFKITNGLDPEKYEVWYMSYNEKPKDWYRIDKFLHRVPYDQVPEVYRQCHILLKSSTLESFSYPPLEMMTTGGLVVAVLNGGNAEYLVDGENCLLYESGNPAMGREKIEQLAGDEALKKKLSENGIQTGKRYEWKSIEKQILALYDK